MVPDPVFVKKLHCLIQASLSVASASIWIKTQVPFRSSYFQARFKLHALTQKQLAINRLLALTCPRLEKSWLLDGIFKHNT